MDYRPLGRTGVKVSPLCLGTMNFGGRTEEKEAKKILDAALDAGVNFIDTANVYGHTPMRYSEERGRTESILGRVLGKRRQRVVLASKLFFPMSDDPNDQGSSRQHIIASCEASLIRLNTDHIDLLQLHSATNDTAIDESLRALDDLIRAGKVRYFGTSGFPSWKLTETLWVSDALGLNRVVSEQAAYNLLDRRAERELIPMAQSYDIAILPWAPTAGGFLSGKYKRGEAFPDDSRFTAFWKGFGADHIADGVFDAVELVETIAKEKAASSYQVALAWTMNQPGVTSAITGPRSLEQMQSSLKTLDIRLSKEDHVRLDAVSQPGRVLVGYYGGDSSGIPWTGWLPNQFSWR